MDTTINLPYKIGQKLYVAKQIRRHLKSYDVLIKETQYYKEYREEHVWENTWVVKEKYLKEILIDEDGLNWTFADNEDLTDNDSWDEDHHYLSLYDNEVYIFTNESEANNYVFGLNTLNKLIE